MKSKHESLLIELENFAGTKQNYRGKRCGRYVEGIRHSLMVIRDGHIKNVMKEDFDYTQSVKGILKGKKTKKKK